MLTVWVHVFATLVAGGGLRVETGTPAALCPDIGEVRRAVRDRLNVEGQGEWLASYDLIHRPEAGTGDVVRVELRDPAGRLRLQRELPRSGESCVALAQAVALVLESFFRHPADEAAVPVGPAVEPLAVTTTAAPPSALGWGPAVDVAGAWAIGPSSPAVAIDLWYGGRSPPSWAAGVEGVWLASEQRLDIDFGKGTGTGAVRTLLFRGWAARRLRPAAPMEILVGPELVLAVDRMTTSGLPAGRSNHREGWGVGARAQLRFGLTPRTALSLIAALDYTPRAWGGRFTIGDLPGEFAPSPEIRLFIGAGLGIALFE